MLRELLSHHSIGGPATEIGGEKKKKEKDIKGIQTGKEEVKVTCCQMT